MRAGRRPAPAVRTSSSTSRGGARRAGRRRRGGRRSPRAASRVLVPAPRRRARPAAAASRPAPASHAGSLTSDGVLARSRASSVAVARARGRAGPPSAGSAGSTRSSARAGAALRRGPSCRRAAKVQPPSSEALDGGADARRRPPHRPPRVGEPAGRRPRAARASAAPARRRSVGPPVADPDEQDAGRAGPRRRHGTRVTSPARPVTFSAGDDGRAGRGRAPRPRRRRTRRATRLGRPGGPGRPTSATSSARVQARSRATVRGRAAGAAGARRRCGRHARTQRARGRLRRGPRRVAAGPPVDAASACSAGDGLQGIAELAGLGRRSSRPPVARHPRAGRA